MRLISLKVRTRIYLGFTALILLAVALAGAGVYQFGDIGRDVTRMDALAGNTQRVLMATRNIEGIRRAENRYRLDRQDTALKDIRNNIAAARQLMIDSGQATLSEDRRRIYRAVQDTLDAHAQELERFLQFTGAYVAARDGLFSGGDALTGATDRLMEAVHAAPDGALREAASRVERSVLRVRAANWRFLATQDESGPATFKENVEKTGGFLIRLGQVGGADIRPLVAAVEAAMASYQASFNAYVDARQSADQISDTVMRPQVQGMQQQLEAAAVGITAAFEDSRTIALGVAANASLLQELLAAIGLVLGGALAVFIGRGIVGPLTGMTGVMTKLAAGDRSVVVPARDNTDEIGDMARAVEVFRQNAIEAERLAAEQAAARAAKERRQAAMEQHTQDFGASVSGVMAGLAESAETMRRAAATMSDAAGGVHAEATGTAGTAAKSSQDLMSVAAAVEQLTASVDEISRQVTAAANVARQAVQRAEAGQGSIRGLADSTSRIGDVVRLISDIAGQTNLLALNATIEAARAGEAGRGFAVVAGEVKALASQTARATAEIGSQIETVRGATEQTITAMTEVGEIISKMDEVTAAISAAVEEQSTSTREIAASIQDVSHATADSARAMEHVVSVANAAGEASRDVTAGAAGIGQQAGTLRTEVDQFLAAVKDVGDDRRRYERVPATGAFAGVRMQGREAARLELRDLSRGGAGLACTWSVAPGAAVQVDLPGAGGEVSARVVRGGGGVLAVVFGSEPAALARIDRALDALQGNRRAA